MKSGRAAASVILAAGFFSCTVSSRTVMSPPDGYDGPAAAYYYHAEGLKAAMIARDTSSAAGMFRRALAVDSCYAPAWFHLAELVIDKDADSAAGLSRRAGRIDTANVTYRSQLGRAYVLSGRYDDALGIYTSLMRDDPYNPLNYQLLSALYEFRGQPFTAISILDTAETRMGRVDELFRYRRELLFRVGLYDKALEETERLVAEYPYEKDNYRMLGELYAAKGQDSAALANFGTALRFDSTDVETLSSLSDFYLKRNNQPEYLATLRRLFDSREVPLARKKETFKRLTSNIEFYRQNYYAINTLAASLASNYPEDYSVLELYAGHLVRGGELERALELYKMYVRREPDRLAAWEEIIGMETYLQRPDSVSHYLDAALEHFPGDIGLLLSKSYSRQSMGDFAGALDAARTAYRAAGDDSTRSVVLGIRGDIYHSAGNDRKAFSMYDKALRLHPDNVAVLNNYAYFLGIAGGDLGKAIAMARRANELTDKDPTFLDTEGWLLFLAGRYEEARQVMQRAVTFDASQSGVLFFHYAEVLHALGDDFMARVYWNKALENGFDSEIILERFKLTEDK